MRYLPNMMRGGVQGVQGMIATRGCTSRRRKAGRYSSYPTLLPGDYWLDGLASHNTDVVWQYPYDRPHNYLITDFEAYLDIYRATGDESISVPCKGRGTLSRQMGSTVGGSIAITEFGEFPPKSYIARRAVPILRNGETCGSVFGHDSISGSSCCIPNRKVRQ